MTTSQERQALRAATKRYRASSKVHERSHAEVVKAIVAALKAGEMPTEVAADSPFTATYVRKLARDHDIPPARQGLKKKETKS